LNKIAKCYSFFWNILNSLRKYLISNQWKTNYYTLYILPTHFNIFWSARRTFINYMTYPRFFGLRKFQKFRTVSSYRRKSTLFKKNRLFHLSPETVLYFWHFLGAQKILRWVVDCIMGTFIPLNKCLNNWSKNSLPIYKKVYTSYTLTTVRHCSQST
jgi:hypothetical protein